MGWSNSVPIFHDDVTFILKDEIPHVTAPYIDDVAVKGPESDYCRPDGSYETVPENSGILSERLRSKNLYFVSHLRDIQIDLFGSRISPLRSQIATVATASSKISSEG